MKSTLAAGVCLLALGAASADAKTFGHVAGDVNYTDFGNAFTTGDINAWRYGVQGAVGFDVSPTWNVQFDLGYNSEKYSFENFSSEPSVDTLAGGTEIFWRDASQGLVGLEVAYRGTSSFGTTNEGYTVALRGEVFSSDTLTFGGSLLYSNTDFYGGEIDTWGGGLFATYYASANTAVSLRGFYETFEADTNLDNTDDLKLTADVEYLFQNNLSLTGSVGWTDGNNFSTGYDAFSVGAKLKFYFGTEGTLANQHRTSTLEPITSSLGLLPLI